MTIIDHIGHEAAPDNGVVATFPCSTTQQRCWFLNQLNPGNPALNVHIRWEIRGRFKAKSIERAFQEIMVRHEILRTRFVEQNGDPVQEVMERAPFKLSVIDLRHVPAAQHEERIRTIGGQVAREPFDLSKPGLIRATLLQLENERAFLLTTLHQTCFDGWSIRVLGREVGEITSAIEANRDFVLAELPLQYGDYAMWQSDYLASGSFDNEINFWKERLTGAPYFEVQPDYARGATASFRGDLVSSLMSKELGAKMEAEARNRRMSLFAFGTSVVGAVLHRLTDENDILFGTQVAGRDQTDLETLIGVFINNLVMRFDIPSDATLEQHFANTNAVVQQSLVYQRMPFNRLVKLINPPRDPSRNPLISVNFNMHPAFLENAKYGGIELISAPSQSPGAIYDLNFMMIGRPDGWRMTVEYNPDLFEKATVQQILGLWEQMFEIAVSQPQTKLSDLPSIERSVAHDDEAALLAKAETLLRDHPSVGEVAGVLHQDGGRHQPYFFVTPSAAMHDPLERMPATLMHYLAQTLEAADMPGGISVLSALPRSPSGHIKRSALVVQPSMLMTAAPVAKARAPQDLEDEIGKIWASVLGVETVDRNTSFFDLGGHSLLAVQMFARMKARFDTKPDLSVLFRAPSLSEFAAALHEEGLAGQAPEAADNGFWKVVDLQKSDGSPLVLSINHPLLYYRMAQGIGKQVPFVNAQIFEPQHLGDKADMTMEEIVASGIRAIRAEKPHGPYALIGLCVNGIVALEAARQLKAAGEEVTFVAMIDSWRPGFVLSRSALQRNFWRSETKARRLGHFAGRLLTGRMSPKAFLSQYNFSWKIMLAMGMVEPLNEEARKNQQVTGFLTAASRRHRPAPYDGDVVLFRSESTSPRASKLMFGWKGVLKDDTPVHELEGWHEGSLTSDGVKSLGGIVGRQFGDQQTRKP